MDNKKKPGTAKKKVQLKDLKAKKASHVKGGAADIFAKIGDIKGESTDDKHKGEIEIDSW